MTFRVSFHVMVALTFYATGSFQTVIIYVHNDSSVFRILKTMTQCLIDVKNAHNTLLLDSHELAKAWLLHNCLIHHACIHPARRLVTMVYMINISYFDKQINV